MKETLVTALKASGEELLKYFDKPLETKVKESQSSIVTEADMRSNSLIIDLISSKFPSHNILSEETGFSNNNSRYTWVIDPLDGTSNFASSLPWFGILIALFDNNTPVMGGAYLPVNDILYVAEKDKGAFRNGKLLKMKEHKELISSLITFAVDYTDDEPFLNKCIEIYKNIVKSSRNIRCTNSLVDFIYVAEGKSGGCINLFTRVWDIAALGLIISEAGGELVDIYGRQIDYNIGNEISERNFSVIAGSVDIVKSLAKIVNEAG